MARKKGKLAVAEFPLIDEALFKSRIYTIRGVKVMLDADLAEIYGYSTKAFNRQVKNNIDRFAEDFRFQLSKSEVDELRLKILTAITGANNTENLRCKLHRKSQHDEPLLSLCFYGTGYLYAHDSVERRFGSTTEYGPYSPFQADEGLHCGEPTVDWG